MKSSLTTLQARPGLPGPAAPDNSSHDHPNVLPPPKPLRRILTGLAAALTVAGSAHATLIIGEEQKQPNGNDPTPIGVVSGDLLETSVASVTGEPAKISGGVGSGVRNGSYNDYSAPYINNTTTYVLDITSKPAGYDIKEIRLFSGWGTRATQAYDINYSLVGDPGTFLLLGTYTGTLPPSSDNTLMTRTYDSSAGAVPDSGVPILTGVAAIQFVIRANGNATLYHEWDVTGNATGAGTHTLTYDGNGSDSGVAPVDPNSPYADLAAVTVLGSGTLAKTGYSFSGWNTAANGTGTSYNPAATFAITADTTLYATWAAAVPGLVFGEEQYDPNGAAPAPIGVVSGDLLETSVASVTGEPASIDGGSPLPHLRNGIWGDYVAPSGSGYTTTYALDITSHPAGYNINEIHLFSNGGSRTTQAYDIKYSLIGAPSTFLLLGTYTGTLPPSGNGTLMTRTYKNGGGALLTGVAGIQFVIRANGLGTLYREWDVLGSATGGGTHTVTYSGNGSDSGVAPVDPNSPYADLATVTVMDSGTLAKTGYSFRAWNTAADGTGTSYNPAANFGITADTTLYAQWIKVVPGLVFGEEQYQSNGADPSPIGVVSGDLLETSVASVTGEPGTISGTPGPALRDGTFNSYVGYSNGYTTTYALDITSHPVGYDINEIRLFSNGGSRTTQAYDINYSLVGAPTMFLLLGTYTGTLPPSGNGTLMTRTYKNGGGGLLTGVAAIQFVIRANGNGTLYREWDVTGSATGGTGSPYDTWKTGTFANAFTDTDPTHDPDGDGMTNQQEFAFGLDPTSGTSVNPVTPLVGTQFTYTRYANSGLNYTVEYSTDLTGWAPATTLESIGDPDAKGVQTVTVTVSDTPVDGKLFVRVRAE